MHLLKSHGLPFTYEVDGELGLIYIYDLKKNLIYSGRVKWVYFPSPKTDQFPLWIPYEVYDIQKKYGSLVLADNNFIWLREDGSYLIIPAPQELPEHIDSQTFIFFYATSSDHIFICYRDRTVNKEFNIVANLNRAVLLGDIISAHIWRESYSFNICYVSGTISFLDDKQDILQTIGLSNVKEIKSWDSGESYSLDIKEPSLFSFDSCVSFLNAWFQWKLHKNRNWSYKLWANEMDLHNNTSILKILKRQRHIGPQIRQKLIHFFSFSEPEEMYFYLLIEKDKKQNLVESKLFTKLANDFRENQKKDVTQASHWFEFRLGDTYGVVVARNKETKVTKCFFTRSENGIFTFLGKGNLQVLSSQQANQTILEPNPDYLVAHSSKNGLHIIGNKIYWLTYGIGVQVVSLESLLVDPEDGRWDWLPILNGESAVLLGKNISNKSCLLFFFDKGAIYRGTSIPQFDHTTKSGEFTKVGNQISIKAGKDIFRVLTDRLQSVENYIFIDKSGREILGR